MYMFVCHVHAHNHICSFVKCFSTSFGCSVCVFEHSCHTGHDEQKKHRAGCMLCIFPWIFEAIHALRDFCTNTSNCYVLWWGPSTSRFYLPMWALEAFVVCWFLPFAVGFSQAQRRLFTGLQSGVVMVWAAQFHAGHRVASMKTQLVAPRFWELMGQLPLRVIPLWFGDLTSNSIGIVPWIGNQ